MYSSDLETYFNNLQKEINSYIALQIFIGIITFILTVALIVAFFMMCKNVSRIRKRIESEERNREIEKIISQIQNLEIQQQKAEDKASKSYNITAELIKEQRKTNELLKQLLEQQKAP